MVMFPLFYGAFRGRCRVLLEVGVDTAVEVV